MANNLVVLQNILTGEETVEAFLEHSKTGHRRYMNALPSSKGAARIEIGKYLREYWSLVGFDMTPERRVDAGHRVTGPDYSVLRLSLVALGSSPAEDSDRFDLVCRLLARSRSPRRYASGRRTRVCEVRRA